MSQIDEIKNKLDIIEVIREYVPLKAVGANFQAPCPFHNEKTPSFVVSPDKQIWHCFGCGKGGDIFSFIMERDGLSFPEAKRYLADKAGVVLEYENKEVYTKRNRLLDILELTSKYFEHCLSTNLGTEAKEYLYKRGLSDEEIKYWRLGYSPNSWDSLYNFLKARPLKGMKYSDDEIFSAGLVSKKDGTSNSYYDRFRDRIMFPINDSNGKVVAFTARINPEKEKESKMGKYINSPQTELYDKSRILFALDKAKLNIKDLDTAIVVEGQMDAISCHNHKINNVVASSGTALTKEQVNLLKRYSNRVALVFDMDEAGQLAADRGIKECLLAGMEVKIITLPSGKDPDESLKNNPDELNRGAEIAALKSENDFEDFYKKPIENAKSVLEYNFEKLSHGLNLNDLDNKKKVRDGMFEMISYISDKTEQGFWLRKLSEDLDFIEADVREEFLRRFSDNVKKENKYRNDNSFESKSDSRTTSKVKNREERLSELFLSILLKQGSLIEYALKNLEAENLVGEDYQKFYNLLIIYYNKSASLDYQGIKKELMDNNYSENLLRELSLLAETEYYELSANEIKKQLMDIIIELKKFRIHYKSKQLYKEIEEAEKNGDSKKAAEIMTDLKKIMDQK